MARQIRVRSIKRKKIDEDKLALAYLMLAKILSDEESKANTDKGRSARSASKQSDGEAA